VNPKVQDRFQEALSHDRACSTQGRAPQPHGHFSEGLDDRRRFPEDERVGRFSKGQERRALDEQKDRHGRFSIGEEALPEDDPEKHVERRFSEGVEREAA
jgi:hypothetical protein